MALAMQVYATEDELIERSQWNTPFLRHLTNVILDLADGETGRALELGCGIGRNCAALAEAGFQVEGIDVNERAVSVGQRIMARRGLDVPLEVGSIFDPSWDARIGSYDLLLCSEVLEHVDDWKALLNRAQSLVRPGGRLILTVPRDPAQFSVIDEYAGHLRRFQDHEMLEALGADFPKREVRWIGWPFSRFIVWAYSVYARVAGVNYSDQSQAAWRSVSPVTKLGFALYGMLLRVDACFSFLPFGSTLVIRARKRATA